MFLDASQRHTGPRIGKLRMREFKDAKESTLAERDASPKYPT